MFDSRCDLAALVYERDPESRVSPGKVQLLENIDACGSISAAGRAEPVDAWWNAVSSGNASLCRRVTKPSARFSSNSPALAMVMRSV
jgi:molybdenum-dependent DNA-binding transcriptional regulator ModE